MMEAVLYRLWAMSLQASILILIVLAVRFSLRKYPRIYSYCLWILVGIRLLCPIWVESPFSLQPDLSTYSDRRGRMADDGPLQPEFIFTQGQGEAANSGTIPQDGGQQIVPAGTGQPEEILLESNGFTGQGTESGNLPEQPGFFDGIRRMLEPGRIGGQGFWPGKLHRVLCFVYLIGVAGCLLFHFGQYLWMKHRIAAAVRDKGNVWLCDKIASPFVMGIAFPKIYLPYEISGTEKKYVLRHERIHIKHHDPLIRIIGTLCACLHWWNPLVWLAVYLMNQDMEMFCDETVLLHAPLEEKKVYAQTLLSFAEKDSGFGAGLAFGESHTEKRIKNIMKKRKRSVLVVCLVAVLAVFCVVALMTVPRAVRDGEEEDPGNVAGSEPALSQDPGTAPVQALGTSGGDTAANPSQGGLSDEDLAWLMEACPGVPDFSLREEMDAAFWEDYLFNTYTSDFDRGQVSRYSEQYGFDIPYIRVSFSEAEETVRQLFGGSFGEYGISPEELGAGGSNLIYEDGFLYIAASDSPAYQFSLENVATTDILTEVSLRKTVPGEESVSRVMLYLVPVENERGFVLDGKEEILAPQVSDGQVLEGQSFEVEMNPYGAVTFAVYAPDVSVSPYADVTFKLLQNGQEIYSFPVKGTGVREDQSVFDGMGAVAFPDLNGDGYTDVVAIAHYQHESGPVPPQIRIFTYNQGGYFLEELYLEDAYNFSHEEKTVVDVEAFATQRENQDYFARTSIYGRWQVGSYKLSGVYALSQDEIDSLVGARLEYGVTSLWTNTDGELNNVNGYERETVAAQDLEADYRISRDDLGISGDEVVYYQVDAEKDSTFGCSFYLIDPEHALIYYEGVFFEATRE